MRRQLTLVLAVVALATACTAAPVTPGPSVPPSATPTPSPRIEPTAALPAMEVARADQPRAEAALGEARDAAEAINAVAFDLHRALAADEGNVVFSPASIAIALGMARAGARGETAKQMDTVFRELAADEHANWLNSLDQALAGRTGTFADAEGRSHDVTLDITNAHFLQRDLEFEEAFLEALATRFGAGLNLVDFVADPEAARALINAWARERTRGRIPEVLRVGDITSDTRFALANAIYLKAPWLQPFSEHQTTTDAFTRPDGSTVEAPVMLGGNGRCANGPGWGAMDLPYLGGHLSMLVVVPDDLAAFEKRLDAGLIESIDAAFTDHLAVELALPRFDFETRTDLANVLAGLGMPDAFDSARADFSGMTSEARLVISKVIHQANITVDEKGTEAAAVTVVIGDVAGPGPTTCKVTADRPFLFAIRDRETGVILFLGRVVDPTAS